MLFHFATVGVFFLLAIAFVMLMLTLGKFLRPQNPDPVKLTTYECGEPPTGSAWLNFNIRFYIVALIFLVFEVEIAFLLPVALVFRSWVEQGQGWFVFAEILVFLAILLVGLVYVWAKGDFDWLKRLAPIEEQDEPMKDAA
ncbi:MAG TPA: NADH-quinone oxidoreductase subunit A [Terriglobales bacterium]|nr:NADH-quinone oxidoreductase subunit A [Terriglobales bacterium]